MVLGEAVASAFSSLKPLVHVVAELKATHSLVRWQSLLLDHLVRWQSLLHGLVRWLSLLHSLQSGTHVLGGV